MRRIIPVMAVLAVLVVLAGIAAIEWRRRAATSAALASLQRQSEELRSQLEARDRAIADVRTAIDAVPRSAPAIPTTEGLRQPDAAASRETELVRRLAELAVVQSNTLALVERLMERATTVPLAESPQQRQAGLVALEQSVVEFQQKVDAARQRTADLLVGLNIPAEVSTMDPSKALATVSLKPYWPFFEALREREHLTFLMERLEARLLQEQLDARAAAEKAKAQ